MSPHHVQLQHNQFYIELYFAIIFPTDCNSLNQESLYQQKKTTLNVTKTKNTLAWW